MQNDDVRITVLLGAEAVAQLDEQARADDRSRSGQVRYILNQHFGAPAEDDGPIVLT